MHPHADITQLLTDWSAGDAAALEKLLPLVESQLLIFARKYLRQMHSGNTLQPTVLINETYLHLIGHEKIKWQNRAHFFGVATIIMRQFLLNYIRRQNRLKRGGRQIQVTLGDAMIVSDAKSEQILALDEALRALEKFDDRKAKVVELKYFGGLSHAEIAEILKVSEMTVLRDWKFARAWLAKKLK